MALVLVGMQLERARSLDGGDVVSRSGHELQPDGKILFREATRNGERGQAAKIAYGALRIRERQARFQIKRERSGGNKLRKNHKHIETLKKYVHFFLENLAHFKGLLVVGS